ncbi:hypothetical protein LTR56_025368 [Elasticomyces elasticus]|nr:hypothetical protein LTR56_025368 [Elasticomyces elasticus]KAK3655277.1 hypothetical protein LTR22_010307 [Elasticomyces elasticus]KAK5748834.1 hypothetical protein LTS12_021131 [Elasticomyces elasticus]
MNEGDDEDAPLTPAKGLGSLAHDRHMLRSVNKRKRKVEKEESRKQRRERNDADTAAAADRNRNKQAKLEERLAKLKATLPIRKSEESVVKSTEVDDSMDVDGKDNTPGGSVATGSQVFGKRKTVITKWLEKALDKNHSVAFAYYANIPIP